MCNIIDATARKHHHWTVEDKHSAAWSEDSQHRLFQPDGGVRVYRWQPEAMDPVC